MPSNQICYAIIFFRIQGWAAPSLRADAENLTAPVVCVCLPAQRLLFYCRATFATTSPCTFRRMCCPTHCASYCAPCQPLLREFAYWIRSPPSTSFHVSCQHRNHSRLKTCVFKKTSFFIKVPQIPPLRYHKTVFRIESGVLSAAVERFGT